jgi:hypothetical protein
MIEPEFRNDYEKPLNVFTTRSRSDAVLIESQFQYTTNAFYEFYAPLLNASYQSVTTLLNRTYPEASTYVCAVLAMSNATGTVGDIVPTATAGVPANGAGDGGGGGGGNKGTSLAMIILYAIAGVIIIIVAVVIYMGAMRAARNPDRYGPRAAGGGQARGYPYNYDDEDAFDDAFATRMGYATGGQTGQHLPAQTRTQGLARAIVDSFPLVKFARRDQRADGGTRREEIDGQQRPAPLGNESTQRPRVERADESSKGSYLSGGEVESLPLEPMYRRSLRDDKRSATEDDTKSSQAAQVEVLDASPSGSTHYRRTSADGLTAAPIDTRSIGSAMGDEPNLALEETEEHCPICLLDFEDGDDMRVLPCEGSHQFHAVCIDQWLLEISSSCPLCRKGGSSVLFEPQPFRSALTATESFCPPTDFSLLDTSSTTSLPLADSGQTTPPSGSAVSANVAPAPAPTAAAPSRTRIQGFLRRVRSTQVRPGQPPAASSSRGQRRPSNAETAARQHSIALSSAALF